MKKNEELLEKNLNEFKAEVSSSINTKAYTLNSKNFPSYYY